MTNSGEFADSTIELFPLEPLDPPYQLTRMTAPQKSPPNPTSDHSVKPALKLSSELDWLNNTHQFYVRQHKPAFAAGAQSRKFSITTTNGEEWMTATEDLGPCTNRPGLFVKSLQIFDKHNRKIMDVSRTIKTLTQNVEIKSDERWFGRVQRQLCGNFTPRYEVLDEEGEVTMAVIGPGCCDGPFKDITEYQIVTLEVGSTEAGKLIVTEKNGGFLFEGVKEYLFSLSAALELQHKLSLIATCFLMEMWRR